MHVLTRWLAVAAAALVPLGAVAETRTDMGTWTQTLHARDIHGRAVALDSEAAVFFYDETLDITWLRDLAPYGAAAWDIVLDWADALVVGGFDDWRLPRMFDAGAPGCDFSHAGGTDCGYNVLLQYGNDVNEMAHLFYVTLGNVAAYAPGTGDYRGGTQGVDWGLVNTAHFSGDFADSYWSSLQLPDESNDAWRFRFTDGAVQVTGGIQDAMVVRDGDVLSPVPEPAGQALMLAGLATLLGWRRLRRG